MGLKFQSERIIYYDFIRAFAIFGVVACHCFGGLVVNANIFNTNLWYYSLLLNSLRSLSVDLFIVLSGALLITKKDSIKVFIKKRFNRVIIPYIFWVLIFLIVEITFWHYGNPYQFISQTISFNPVGSAAVFWFVHMILIVYVLIFILNKLTEFNRIFLKLSLIASILFVVLFNFNLIPPSTRPYNYVFFMIFAIFGFYLKSYDFTSNSLLKSLKINEEKLAVIFLALSILLYLLEVYFNAINSIGSNAYTPVSPFSFLNVALVISVFLFFRYFSESKGKFNKLFNSIVHGKVGKLLLSLSFCSYGIYLCHVIIYDILIHLNFKGYLPPSIYYTILLVMTLVVSWLIILAMSRIPYLKKVSGSV